MNVVKMLRYYKKSFPYPYDIYDAHSTISHISRCLESMEQQRTQSDEMISKLKSVLVKTKKELADTKKQVRL